MGLLSSDYCSKIIKNIYERKTVLIIYHMKYVIHNRIKTFTETININNLITGLKKSKSDINYM